jgi:hypothetical protein
MPVRLLICIGAFVLMAGCQSTPTPTPTPTSTAAPRAATPALPPTVAANPTATAPAVTASRVESLNAAGDAFAHGDMKTSAALYDRVLNMPPAPAEGAAGTAAIDDFANFRAMVALLADAREDEAHDHLDALQERDASAPLARLGTQLWAQYGMVGGVRGACAQLQPAIASQATPVLATLQSLSVRADAASLCNGPPG